MKKILKRIILPFTVIWLFEILVLVFIKKETHINYVRSYVFGGLGPGSFFTPVFLQFLITFPIIFWTINKFDKFNQNLMIIGVFCLSLLLEWICVVLNTPDWVYRLLFVRYVFASVLGIYFVKNKLNAKPLLLVLLVLSVVYIYAITYLHSNLPNRIIYPAWGFQHAPGYFFTAFLLVLLWKGFPVLKDLGKKIAPIGKASYHIFLFQMVYFYLNVITQGRITRIVPNLNQIVLLLILLVANITICTLFGYLFFRLNSLINKHVLIA
jgi:hypothetical protein